MAQQQQSYYELYRGSSLGLSLTDTLDDLINEGRIEPQLAMKILSTFDKVVTEVLAEKVRARLTFKVHDPQALVWDYAREGSGLCVPIEGHLDTYRFCDEVWTFLIKDVTFKLDNQTTVSAERVKIVSCNSKRPGET
ncbi:Transcription initiation factor IIA subunit 2 [Penicillium diatomitis]|uniref:Transcription initiation factor IIA subunit 2 n=1 Tax=Penicillium diatomitis TaxID=2819901 RepID=A0A9W9XCI4_9EURO|nr:Transcription initiation factor IIA subunit 2 [Penicillium diatomitis]KAJ5488779.1 Transcription initiation factor IIA subunit 2 [Penicillium diatomitis]